MTQTTATAEQMRRLDALAAAKGFAPLELMENAGKAVAEETRRRLARTWGLAVAGAPVVVCCGPGSNGGDGLVAARCLAGLGALVSAFVCPPRTGRDWPEGLRVNRERAAAAGVSVLAYGSSCGLREALEGAVVALDALLGTGSRGAPQGAVKEMIEALNRSGKPVLAVDIPSGLDADTGEAPGAVVRASATLTLGLAKKGLAAEAAQGWVGELQVLDIGYPPELVREVVGA